MKTRAELEAVRDLLVATLADKSPATVLSLAACPSVAIELEASVALLGWMLELPVAESQRFAANLDALRRDECEAREELLAAHN